MELGQREAITTQIHEKEELREVMEKMKMELRQREGVIGKLREQLEQVGT